MTLCERGVTPASLKRDGAPGTSAIARAMAPMALTGVCAIARLGSFERRLPAAPRGFR
jgi:hypothetical protein